MRREKATIPPVSYGVCCLKDGEIREGGMQLSQKSTLLRRHRRRCSGPRLFPTVNGERDKTAFGKKREARADNSGERSHTRSMTGTSGWNKVALAGCIRSYQFSLPFIRSFIIVSVTTRTYVRLTVEVMSHNARY